MICDKLFVIVRGIENDLATIHDAIDEITSKCNRKNLSNKKVKLEVIDKTLSFTLVEHNHEVKGVILLKDIYEKVKSKESSPSEIEQIICDMIESKAVEEFFS